MKVSLQARLRGGARLLRWSHAALLWKQNETNCMRKQHLGDLQKVQDVFPMFLISMYVRMSHSPSWSYGKTGGRFSVQSLPEHCTHARWCGKSSGITPCSDLATPPGSYGPDLRRTCSKQENVSKAPFMQTL